MSPTQLASGQPRPGEPVSPLEWTTALGVLTDDGAAVFDIEAADAELKLRRLIGTVLSYPAFNYQ